MEKDMIDELEQQQAFEEALKDDHEKLRARIVELEAAALKYLADEGQRCEQIEAAQKRAWNAALEAAVDIEAAQKRAWNAALEAAVDAVQESIFNLRSPRDTIRALMKKEGE